MRSKSNKNRTIPPLWTDIFNAFKPSMSDNGGVATGVILTTALASVVTGYMVGIFTTRGYIISPSMYEERRRNLNDPEESDESDVDEGDSILDHAPNWANGAAADRRQGLSASEPHPLINLSNEECKLVLVVRTDLGMTKGKKLNPVTVLGRLMS